MRTLSSFSQFIRVFAWAAVLLVCVAGCGDDGSTLAPELFGTWDSVSIEANGTTQTCPGELTLTDTESVSCGTQATTFNADGTFIDVQTTDELGDPFDSRQEGTWSTQGSTLFLTFRQGGPDADNLQPIDPPVVQSMAWSVLASRLTLSITSTVPPFTTVIGTLQKR